MSARGGKAGEPATMSKSTSDYPNKMCQNAFDNSEIFKSYFVVGGGSSYGTTPHNNHTV